jgi:hypothetical protein
MLGSRWIVGVVIIAVGATAGVVAGRRQEPAGVSVAPAEGVTGNWELGEFTVDVDTTVGSGGGEIAITDGDLAGLTLSIPDAALPDDTPVVIEHAPIVSHTWGDAVDPATPAIRIEIGDGSYADDAMTVSIPVDLADGRLALGLYVDDSGRLEGIPTTGTATGGVEILTRHFSDWFISLFDPDDLPDEIFTGYQVARDNWQFVNRGSYISPGGICAGMAMSSMWYYLEQYRANDAPPLFRRYDYPHGTATPNFELDDAHAIRFASMVQRDGNWASSKRTTGTGVEWVGSPTAWDWFRESRYLGHDRWQFEAFRYAMYLTGEPQYVTMGRTGGKGGHAIVGYGVSLGTFFDDDGNEASGGELWVSDPNAPYALRSIRYDDARQEFLAYTSALRADGTSLAFDAIGLAGKSAMFDWGLIGTRFQEMVDGVVGDQKFPVPTMHQWVVDPTTGVGSWQVTSSPTPNENGLLELAFTLPGGIETWVGLYEDGKTAWTESSHQGPNANRTAIVQARATSNTYKLIVLGKAEGGLSFIDAVPLVIPAAPVASTTTTMGTTTTTAAPTTTVAPAPLPTDPPLYDCTACADGVAGLECRLHCESIGALP